MSTFKQKDRVRRVDSSGPIGTVFAVANDGSVLVKFDGQHGHSLWWMPSELTHAEPDPAPFKIDDRVEHVDHAPGFIMTVAADQFTSGAVEVTHPDGSRHDYQAKFLKHAEPDLPEVQWEKVRLTDPVNHPTHYTSDPSGVECIEITRHRNFNVGNSIKYLWRAGLKQDADKSARDKEIEDLRKSIFYINDEIKRLEKENP